MAEWEEWDVLDWQAFEAFDDLSSFVKNISAHLDATLHSRREKAEAFLGETSAELFQDLEEWERRVGYSFATSLTNSVVVLIYSQAELLLKRLAEILCKIKGFRVGLSSFRGGLTERTDLFFMAYQLPPLLDSERQGLQDLTLIRNCIVHNGGFLKGYGSEGPLLQLARRTEGITLRRDQSLSISTAYCASRAVDMRNLFRRLVYENFDREQESGESVPL